MGFLNFQGTKSYSGNLRQQQEQGSRNGEGYREGDKSVPLIKLEMN
jgi:hypothetical protein